MEICPIQAQKAAWPLWSKGAFHPLSIRISSLDQSGQAAFWDFDPQKACLDQSGQPAVQNFSQQKASLVPRPHPLRGIWVWERD